MALNRDLIEWFEKKYPRSLAEPWDSVGVISGEWLREVETVLLTVDITNQVLDEAISVGATFIAAHHPLVLPRHSIVTEPYKFQLISRANNAGVMLFNAHTNADNARPGVADALAATLGLMETDALLPTSMDSVTGTGRIGNLSSPMTASAFVDLINEVIPQSRAKLHGDPHRVVQRVALCPGSGDFMLSHVAKTDADIYVTSDLRHHPVLEHSEAGGCPLIDINHVAAEAQWLPVLAEEISQNFDLSVHLSSVDSRAWLNH
jgi:dinuclear metal center YbgI/SA1388 family protein